MDPKDGDPGLGHPGLLSQVCKLGDGLSGLEIQGWDPGMEIRSWDSGGETPESAGETLGVSTRGWSFGVGFISFVIIIFHVSLWVSCHVVVVILPSYILLVSVTFLGLGWTLINFSLFGLEWHIIVKCKWCQPRWDAFLLLWCLFSFVYVISCIFYIRVIKLFFVVQKQIVLK